MDNPDQGVFLAKLLVIEDEDGARQVIARLLTTYGFNVVEAADGEQGLELFGSQGDISVVLTDLTLPGKSGWDVAKEVKEKSPGTPVIVLSGWDINDSDRHIKESGVSRVLSKPVKIKDIVAAVRELTENKQ